MAPPDTWKGGATWKGVTRGKPDLVECANCRRDLGGISAYLSGSSAVSQRYLGGISAVSRRISAYLAHSFVRDVSSVSHTDLPSRFETMKSLHAESE